MKLARFLVKKNQDDTASGPHVLPFSMRGALYGTFDFPVDAEYEFRMRLTNYRARVRGKPIDDVTMHREIGYLPEQPYFYDYLTARELLYYYARFFGYAPTERRERRHEHDSKDLPETIRTTHRDFLKLLHGQT